MLISVSHKTDYTYSKEVFLESNEIRLCPRSDLSQIIKKFNIEINPKPYSISQCIDSEGNSVIKAWFQGTTDKLIVNIDFEIETTRTNPYDFIADFGYTNLPFCYTDKLQRDLNNYLQIENFDENVKDFSKKIKEESNGETINFLSLLAQTINSSFEYEIRNEGNPQKSCDTLFSKKGSCRDFSVLFADICRYQGIASRFVSGYHMNDDIEEPNLHAWVEVYIPGGGWRGFDPTLGLAITDRHIAVTASYNPQNTAPIKGSFRSNDATASMNVEMSVKRIL